MTMARRSAWRISCRSWWLENPFLLRRELDERHRGWHPPDQLRLDPAPAGRLASERRTSSSTSDLALRQVHWHQQYLAAFREPRIVRQQSRHRRGGRAARGQLRVSVVHREQPVAAPTQRGLLERELAHNTFPSGVNRELASDYHGFVAELGFFRRGRG